MVRLVYGGKSVSSMQEDAAEVDLFLCSINDQIKMLFELTSMDKYFNILGDRQEFERQLQKN